MNNCRGTVTFGSVRVDAVAQAEALRCIVRLIEKGDGGAVFTPNVDHVVLAETDARLRAAYARASLSLADGRPLLWAARLIGKNLPERVAGSDLVLPLLRLASELRWRVYFLGGAPGNAAIAREKVCEQLPQLRVVGVDAPAVQPGLAVQQYGEVLVRIRAVRPDLLLVGLGAPKQEIWIDTVRDSLRPAVLMGVGASLDFLAGAVPRAPRWMSDVGFEWLFRLYNEPVRLWKRYLLRDPRFLVIIGKLMIKRFSGKGNTAT